MKTKINTGWNLKLFYKSHTDPKIEADLKKAEKMHEDFAKKYKNADFTKDEISLVAALKDYEKLAGDASGSYPITYFSYAKDLNADDKKAEAEINKISDRLTKASNKIIFFELVLGKIPEAKQKQYLASSKLSPFKYFLSNIFAQARYNLTEAEEKIMSLKSLPSYEMWVSSQDKLKSKQTVLWKKKELPIDEALGMIPNLPLKERRSLHSLSVKKLKSISDFAEAEMNAIYTNKKINDELRGFKNAYDATLLSHETDESMVMALRDAVTKNSKISHRFYKLKAKLLKQQKLTYADRAAAIGTTTKKVPFEKGLEIVGEAFAAMDPNFKKILDSYIENSQIDVYPKKGKTGGAYCSSGIGQPTMVLLNHLPDMDSVSTLAHEMGHAIHSEYTKSQAPLYQGWSIAAAEVASTFFEEVLFYRVLPTLSPKEQIVALHDKINDEISTIFRQIACFNFEMDLHAKIRNDGAFSKEEIGALHNKNMKAYLGPVFDLTEEDGYFFVNWGHIRRFFYVYSYAYGCLVSKALYRTYQKDPAYLEQIKTFLSAGISKSPRDIFKSIGIDTSDPKFWEEGLASIEEDIKKLEKLTSGK
jgi:oligoendopeptidase F